MDRLLWISLAGAAGTATRYLLTLAVTQRFGSVFPIATILINLIGCFLMAAVVFSSTAFGWSQTARMAVTVGFLGGFTTYSSFNQETMTLCERGATSAAFVNIAITLVGGLVAGWLGVVTARWFTAA